MTDPRQPFEFAGFRFPRHIPRLVPPDYCGEPAPLARMRERFRAWDRANADWLAFRHYDGPPAAEPGPKPPKAHRFKVNTSYSTAPKPGADGAGFYLESDFQPGLRWTWADEVEGSGIRHQGWYSDDDGTGETIRGIVFRLPRSRGFLAGWSMGQGMTATIETDTVYPDEREAARAADSIAERVADRERDYQRAWQAGRRFEDLADRVKELRRGVLAALGELKQARRTRTDGGAQFKRLCDIIRENIDSALAEIRKAREERARLAREFGEQPGFAE